ncbi:hypothetical protein ASD58_00015 [Duganella sp. Root1480D1]|nr:hypothetical protein ASD58_00015 [Duganella sp. Root1480D1]
MAINTYLPKHHRQKMTSFAIAENRAAAWEASRRSIEAICQLMMVEHRIEAVPALKLHILNVHVSQRPVINP